LTSNFKVTAQQHIHQNLHSFHYFNFQPYFYDSDIISASGLLLPITNMLTMAALHSRCGHYIFVLFLSSSLPAALRAAQAAGI